MKSRKILTYSAAFAVAISAVFTSCQKAKTTTPNDTDTSEAQDHTLAETSSNDIITMSSQVSESGSTNSYRSSSATDVFNLGCTTVYRDTVRRVDSVVFNGACLDGKTRTGALTFAYASSTARHYRNPGFSCTVKSYNYLVNGNQVNIINKTITNTTPVGFNPTSTNLTWAIAGNLSIVKANNAGTHTFTYNRTKTLLNTADTTVYHGQAIAISWNKARVGIAGSANGVTAKGANYSANITSLLIRDMNCSPDAAHPGHHPYIQGTIDFSPAGKAVRIIDYGNGSCDLNATVTINGVSHAVVLP